MPSLVTDNFRVFAAEQFIESLEEPYDSSNIPVADSDAAALKFRSKVYLFTGRSQPWPIERYDGVSGVSEFEPPAPFDSFNDMNELYDDMISMKRVNRTDLSQVIRRNTWKENVKYDMYKNNYTPDNLSLNGQSSLYDSQFYVINSNYQVYKCIYNGISPSFPDARESKVEPTGTSTSIIESSSDGYRWKYMYTINISDYIRFVSSDFIPVKSDSSVTAAAVEGSIEQLVITNRGSSLSANTYYCPIIGDGTTGAIARVIVPASGSNASKIDNVALEVVGAGYTRGTVLLGEAYTSVANAVSRTGSSSVLNGSVETIISPPGGHGSNPALELGGYRVMINKSLEFLDGDGDIPVDSQFRRYGLIADPQTPSNLDLVTDTATACFSLKFPTSGSGSPTGDFEPGKIITQSATGAAGRVIHWDSVTKVLKYYQNEFIDESNQTGQNKYKLVPFSGDNQISSTTTQGNITGTPGGTGSYFGVTFASGYATPEVKKNSGNVIYVENRKAVNRSNDQVEDIKLVVEF
tara:strand:+ start:20655 stop:22220 length:1566 start_codon:yes stop_codon:yes gene_type:complete